MAHSYYSPRRVRRHSVSDLPDNNDTITATVTNNQNDELAGEHDLDLERSIFIFPCPSSSTRARTNTNESASADPSSPMSVPTDASFPTTFSPTSTSNTNTNTDADIRGRGRATSNVSGFSEWTSFSGRSVSVDTRASPLVEVWEMSDDALEGEQQQRQQAPLYTASADMRQRFGRPLGTRPSRSQFVFSDGRFHLRAQAQVRARGDSFVSSDTEKSHEHASINESTRNTQTRLPLLAFFSSLMNVEDGTLRLLTCPHPSYLREYESPLFPSASPQSTDAHTWTDTLFDEKQRTAAQLSALALDKTEYSASLKAGMDVACDRPGSESVFALPLPVPKTTLIPFAYLVGLMKELCSYGMAVPQKIRLTAPAA